MKNACQRRKWVFAHCFAKCRSCQTFLILCSCAKCGLWCRTAGNRQLLFRYGQITESTPSLLFGLLFPDRNVLFPSAVPYLRRASDRIEAGLKQVSIGCALGVHWNTLTTLFLNNMPSLYFQFIISVKNGGIFLLVLHFFIVTKIKGKNWHKNLI